jgi:hypothetical protein
MPEIVGLGISIAAIMTGLLMIARPAVILRQDADYMQDSFPIQARRNVRISGGVLFLLGLAGVYAILFEKGPVDPVGF